MAFSVVFTRRAERDVAATETWLSQLGGASLRRWTLRLLTVVENLEQDPHGYPVADEAAELGIDLRLAVSGRKPHVYRVLFTITGQTVTVHGVRHVARDLLSDEEMEPDPTDS